MTIALLAPLPMVHLDAARRDRMSTIAMGTRAWETLRQFTEVGGMGAPVLIYASLAEGSARPVVSWSGVFGQYQEAGQGGLVPRRWERFRPATMGPQDEEGGHFAGYFTVRELSELETPISIADLRLWASDRLPDRGFVPHGSTIVSLGG